MGREGGDALTIRVCRWKRLKEGKIALNLDGPSEHLTFQQARECYPDG